MPPTSSSLAGVRWWVQSTHPTGAIRGTRGHVTPRADGLDKREGELTLAATGILHSASLLSTKNPVANSSCAHGWAHRAGIVSKTRVISTSICIRSCSAKSWQDAFSSFAILQVFLPPLVSLAHRSVGASGFWFADPVPSKADGTGLREESLYFIKTIFLVAVKSWVLRR